MNYPADLRYSTDHEWAQVEGAHVRIGISDYAQDALGDVVFVDLPDVGREVRAGEALSEIESTKSVSEIYAPVGGTIAEINDGLSETPERVNEDPYGDGWLCVIEASDLQELDALLDADGYRALVEGDQGGSPG
jgi:glycine cleavage system H protein